MEKGHKDLSNRLTRQFLWLIQWPPKIGYAIGLGPVIGWLVLLLRTTGRRTGRVRITPLQYEEINGEIYIASAWGDKTDWLRNIQADARVEIQIKDKRFSGEARIVDDPEKGAEFLERGLKRHPRMMRVILRASKAAIPPDRDDLQRYAKGIRLVIVRKDGEGEDPSGS